MLYLFVFHFNNGCTKASQCPVTVQRYSKRWAKFVRLYFLKYTWYMNDLHSIWKRIIDVFKHCRQSTHLVHSRAAASVENKMATTHHKNFSVYQRRTWDEFKRVLSVAHASQPVERTQNLEYRNQLSGVCWGTVCCSNESNFESSCTLTLFFNM